MPQQGFFFNKKKSVVNRNQLTPSMNLFLIIIYSLITRKNYLNFFFLRALALRATYFPGANHHHSQPLVPLSLILQILLNNMKLDSIHRPVTSKEIVIQQVIFTQFIPFQVLESAENRP